MSIRTYAVNCNDAWLNTEGDDISGSYVKYKDHQEVVSALESKCAALAAENAAMKEWSPNPHSASMFEAIEKAEALMDDGMPELAMVEAFEILKMKRTPATDAFLAEVRAQGVEMFAVLLAEMDITCTERGALAFAAQLRQGEAK